MILAAEIAEDDFIKQAGGLLEQKSVEGLLKLADSISAEYPDVAPWLSWWLHPDRAKMAFQSCSDDKARRALLRKHTNANEGAGAHLKRTSE